MGSHGGLDFVREALAGEDNPAELSDSDEELGETFSGEVPASIRAAVKRVATGHRPPKRLARALLLSGAPPSAVQAARELRCDVCLERRSQPKSQRAASLPAPRAVGERAHVDLLFVDDFLGKTYTVGHMGCSFRACPFWSRFFWKRPVQG